MRTLPIALLALAACAPGRSSLLSTTRVEPGADCADGGVAVQSGIDDDGDGVLGPEEVDATTFVCDGEDGAPGADGQDGTDGQDGADGQDGVPELGPVVEGDYVIENSVDVALLAGVEEITGDLVFMESSSTASWTPRAWSITLPDLQSVGGTIQISSTLHVESLSLPSLTTVGGDLRVEGTYTLAMVEVPSLRTIGGALMVNYASGLRTIEGLEDIDSAQQVYVTSNDSLETFEGPDLVGAVFVMANPALTTVRGFASTEVVTGQIYVSDNPALTTLEGFDALRYAAYVDVARNPSLPCLDAPLYDRFAAAAASFYTDVSPCAR
jgi:hypothetical protein